MPLCLFCRGVYCALSNKLPMTSEFGYRLMICLLFVSGDFFYPIDKFLFGVQQRQLKYEIDHFRVGKSVDNFQYDSATNQIYLPKVLYQNFSGFRLFVRVNMLGFSSELVYQAIAILFGHGHPIQCTKSHSASISSCVQIFVGCSIRFKAR